MWGQNSIGVARSEQNPKPLPLHHPAVPARRVNAGDLVPLEKINCRNDARPDGGIEMTPPSNPRLTGGLPQQITVLVVTEIVAVRVVPAWTNLVLKRVPGVVQVLAVVCGLAYRLGLEMKGVMMKAGGCFVGKSVLGCE